jgi:tRNA threonylcarbamoyladenosine biosynthesis protein TsaB
MLNSIQALLMRVLALDTTTRSGSAALVEDDRIVDEQSGDGARTHALRMPAEIVDLAAAHHWPLPEIDLFAVASGPGSFTGLRIGIATIQGIAFVHGRRVVAVPALEAMAYAAARTLPAETMLGVWLDGYRQDVFTALYRVTAAAPFSRARLAAIDAPAVGAPEATLERWRTLTGADPAAVVGDGAVRYTPELTRHAPRAVVIPPPQLAGVIGLLAVDRAKDAVEPSAVRPYYVRRPDVEVLREKNARAGH